MFISAIVNSIVVLTGLLLILAFLITYLINKDKKQLRRAGLTFVATIIIVVLTSMVEFLGLMYLI